MVLASECIQNQLEKLYAVKEIEKKKTNTLSTLKYRLSALKISLDIAMQIFYVYVPDGQFH